MDWRLVEYAVWTMVGLWAVLFFPNPWVRLLGLLLILFALARGLAEGADERRIRSIDPPPDPGHPPEAGPVGTPPGDDPDAAAERERRRPIL